MVSLEVCGEGSGQGGVTCVSGGVKSQLLTSDSPKRNVGLLSGAEKLQSTIGNTILLRERKSCGRQQSHFEDGGPVSV